MSMTSLCLLEEAPNSNLPSPVLTKMNSKVWNMADFDEYEKQLTEEIAAMKASHQTQTQRSRRSSNQRFSFPDSEKVLQYTSSVVIIHDATVHIFDQLKPESVALIFNGDWNCDSHDH